MMMEVAVSPPEELQTSFGIIYARGMCHSLASALQARVWEFRATHRRSLVFTYPEIYNFTFTYAQQQEHWHAVFWSASSAASVSLRNVCIL